MNKVIFLLGVLLAFHLSTACKDEKRDNRKRNPKVIDISGWEQFEGEDFRIVFPPDWGARKDSFPPDQTMYSVYQESRETELDFPLGVHEQPNLAFMAIYPAGLGTEFPSGNTIRFEALEEHQLNLSFEVDSAASRAFLLKDGQPWGYFLVPAEPPSSWNRNGFIFIQYATRNFNARCYDRDTDERKDLKMCEPLEGDRFVREGNIAKSSKLELQAILANMIFLEKGSPPDQPELSNLSAGAAVSSPLKISGTVAGTWFFEGSFPVELRTESGQLVSTGNAEAQGPWMTSEPVNFSSELSFELPADANEGILILRKANPSGLPRNADSLVVEVEF